MQIVLYLVESKQYVTSGLKARFTHILQYALTASRAKNVSTDKQYLSICRFII